MLTPGPLGNGREGRNRQHRPLQRERQALHHTDGNPHAGKGTWPPPESDGIHRGQRNPGLAEQRLHHRQQPLGMQARNHLVVTQHLAVVQQRD